MSGGVMSNVTLDAALDELGMLSTITNSRQEYIAEQLSRLASLDILQNHNSEPRVPPGGMRTRASSMSTVNDRFVRKTIKSMRIKPYRLELRPSRSRTRSENESDVINHLPHCSTGQHPHLSPVPYLALPIDSMLSSNLFKSRSMESIDARASEDSVVLEEREQGDSVVNLHEVDKVSSGLHRLNVSE